MPYLVSWISCLSPPSAASPARRPTPGSLDHVRGDGMVPRGAFQPLRGPAIVLVLVLDAGQPIRRGVDGGVSTGLLRGRHNLDLRDIKRRGRIATHVHGLYLLYTSPSPRD